jgi:hypothetical protein
VALIDDVLPVIDAGYQLVQSLGVTKYSVRLVTRTWDGGEVGLGTPTDTYLNITPNPERKELQNGAIKLGPIIPAHASGGYTVAQLLPEDMAGVEYWYEVTGPSGAANRYAFGDIDDSESFQYFLTLIPLSLAGPE